jgi:hypothetical protein
VVPDSTLSAALTRPIPGPVGFLLVIALWLMARPYAGLSHDGILYLGQAMLHLRPETMAGDLFFSFGSQDSFTVFSRLLAVLYSHADLHWVQVGLLATSYAALVTLVWHLLEPLGSPLQRWLGLCALAVLSHQYGGHNIFAFAERFVTARTWAEPMALLCLLLLIRGRWWLSSLALFATVFLHPLIAVGCVVVGWCWLLIDDRRWLWATGLCALPLMGGLAGLVPFDKAFQTYDPAWWGAVERFSGQVLVTTWSVTDASTIVFDLLLLALATRWFSTALSRLSLAVLLATVLLLAVSSWGADLAHNVLITQLQLWRVTWMAHLLACALLPALVLHAWQLPQHGKLLALSMCLAVVACNGLWTSGWVFVLWLLGALMLHWQQPRLSRLMVTWAPRMTAAVLVVLSVAILLANGALLRENNGPLGHADITLLLVTLPTLALPLAGLLLGGAIHGDRARLGALALTSIVIAYGIANWDRRNPLTRSTEEGFQQEHPFSRFIPPQAQVMWNGVPAGPWVLLNRASFWSHHQGSGLLFNRETAVEFVRRQKIFEPLELQETLCRMTAALNDQQRASTHDCAPTLALLKRMCRTERGPDFLIFERQLPGAVAQWTLNTGSGSTRTWYLYDCLQSR